MSGDYLLCTRILASEMVQLHSSLMLLDGIIAAPLSMVTEPMQTSSPMQNLLLNTGRRPL